MLWQKVWNFLNTKYAENAKQGLFEAENSLEESFVTNKLCLSGFIVEIINLIIIIIKNEIEYKCQGVLNILDYSL